MSALDVTLHLQPTEIVFWLVIVYIQMSLSYTTGSHTTYKMVKTLKFACYTSRSGKSLDLFWRENLEFSKWNSLNLYLEQMFHSIYLLVPKSGMYICICVYISLFTCQVFNTYNIEYH